MARTAVARSLVLGAISLAAVSHGENAKAPIRKFAAVPVADLRLVMLGRSPAFHATINGHDALLELDTGSFELRLSPDFVAKNGIDTNSVKLKIGQAPEESFKPIIETLGSPERPTLADKLAVKEDGIVGLDILRKYAIGLNTVDSRLVFWLGGKLGSDEANRWTSADGTDAKTPAVRLDLSSRSPEDWFKLKSKVNGHPVNLVLDTGTAISTVNPSLVPILGLKKIAETEVEDIGKTEVLPVMMADSVTFGPFSADFPILNVESEDDPDSDGILGTESLGKGKFLIDLPDSHLYVRRLGHVVGENPLEQRLRTAGLDIFPDSHNHLIILVQPGGPAEKSGIRSGDYVVAFGKVGVDDIQSGPDGGNLGGLFKLGLAILQKDLVLTVRKSDGSQISYPLPPASSK